MDWITLRQLRAVSEIARRGTIASAARALGLTGPAVTLTLKQVEEGLGLTLFDRTAQGMRLTDAGIAVNKTAGEVAGALNRLEETVNGLKGLSAGTVQIGAVSTAKYYTPALIAGFKRQHPIIDMRLTLGNREDVIKALGDFTIDCAIMGRPPKGIPVEAAAFGDHPLVMISGPEHRFAGGVGLSKNELSGETLLVREAGSGTRTSMEMYLADLIADNSIHYVEFGSNETIKQAVMAGLGIAFLSAHTVAEEIKAGRLVAIDMEGLPIRRQWFIVRRRDKTMSPSARAFLDFVVHSGTQFLPHFPKLYAELGGKQPDGAAPTSSSRPEALAGKAAPEG
ncbi:LysR substrate-binding domain-containing protein [Afifella pfennigii]|uniref:LysR substrate-binding domain-containing protein n=1 Tax=Afifella pfennigii TaxID=209897 RepID=UPI000A03469C|nr:LysR substrate-binding domain-containing protein [Afifella pfennigii]